jgi:hypothetical protein
MKGKAKNLEKGAEKKSISIVLTTILIMRIQVEIFFSSFQSLNQDFSN